MQGVPRLWLDVFSRLAHGVAHGVASLFLVFAALIYPLGNDTDRRVMQTREVGDLL